jgi:hypothetical protein
MKHTQTRTRVPQLLLVVVVLLLAGCGSEKQSATTEAPQLPPQPAKINYFYPGQESVPPGDKAQFCYGVEFATSVRVEPPVEEIRPLSNKCVWFEPEKTTELTLIAVGEDGKEVSSDPITIAVKAGAPPSTSASKPAAPQRLIESFVATATVIESGGGSTICYALSEPATLKLEPSSGPLGDDLKKCVLVRPKETTTYTLTATAGGKTDKVSITVRVE